MVDEKEKEEAFGEVKVYTDEEGHSVMRVGTPELESAVRKALTNDKGVTIEKIGGKRKVCLSEPDKDFGSSVCQIVEDMMK
jgi:hypothetical protein